MKKLLALFLLLPFSAYAQVQKPPIPNVAGPTNASQMYSVVPDYWFRSISETFETVSITGGILTADLNKGTVKVISNNANITNLQITGAETQAGRVNVLTLIFVSTGISTSQVWGGQVQLPFGNPPILSATLGDKNPLTLVSIDGGATYM